MELPSQDDFKFYDVNDDGRAILIYLNPFDLTDVITIQHRDRNQIIDVQVQVDTI